MSRLSRLRNLFFTNLSILLLAILAFNLLTPHAAYAVSGAEWKAGRIIDDGLFYSNGNMSVNDIQNFLNARVPTCDTDGSQPSNHWNGSRYYTHAEWGAMNGNPAPYTCLKNYSQSISGTSADSYCAAISGGSFSSAQLISKVANACNVNSTVLLVLLEKEQSLVTDTWPWNIQYRSATGYGCPDTAACDAKYYGFFNQIYNAAWQFNYYAQNPGSFRYKPFQNNAVQFNPNAGCGSSNVFIENRATASLYNYTPYQPNAAALNNLYGSGDSCSAYGNRNFWRLYNDWFGSPIGVPALGSHFVDRYSQLGGASGKLGYPVGDENCTLKNSGCFQAFQGGFMVWTADTGAWENIGAIRARWMQLNAENGKLGYPTSGETCDSIGCSQQYQGGFIVWRSATGAWENIGTIHNRWINLGGGAGKLGYPVGPETCGIKNGGCFQKFQGGYIVWSDGTGAWESIGAIRARWMQLNAENGKLGYPIAGESCSSTGCVQQFERGYMIWNSSTGAWENIGAIRARWLEIGSYSSKLGYPVAGENCGLKDGGCFQKFQGGYMIWNSSTGAWENIGAIRNKWMQQGGENGTLGYPSDGEDCNSTQCSQDFQNGTIFWTPSRGAWI